MAINKSRFEYSQRHLEKDISLVYDGPQFSSKQQLTEKVIDTINCMNIECNKLIVNLYATYRNRLVVDLRNNNDLCNK